MMPARAVIGRQQRLFDDFFKIDELLVTHRQIDGTTSSVQRRLVFERGDSVAVLLFNRDRRTVVLVEQFKALEIGLEELFEQLARGLIEDAKLAIGAYWLQSRTGPQA